MNLELFIAARLLRGKEKSSVSVPIVKIAVVGIALGVCVMLISIFVITGFKQEITTKLSGFMAHIDVTSYGKDQDLSGAGMIASDTLLLKIRELEEVKQVYPYVSKPAILKSKTEVHGVVLKGIDSVYDAAFYQNYLKEGALPNFATTRASNEILLSSSVATLLSIELGDKLNAHFVQNPPRVRPFVVQGIYDTGFKEYDDLVVLCDIRHLQRLNGWKDNQVTGVAVELFSLEMIPKLRVDIDDVLYFHDHDSFNRITTLETAAPQIFDWLNLLNMNVVILLSLIIIVSGFNMVSGLLILILDKTGMIGILKALGCKNISLKKLFLYMAIGLIAKGIFVGNILAFVFGGLQYFFQIIRLDPATYYMDTVPIHFDLTYVLLLNVGVLLVSVLMLVAPTILISKISPIKAIRFE